jgi:L-threonylcarbamoyladenylate synthase
VTATSANPSGAEPARTAAEARNYFRTTITIFLDGGTLSSRNGSTVAAVLGDKLQLIREGDVPASALEAVLGRGTILG